MHNRIWHIPKKLNTDLMKEGSKYLIGKHDFRSFMSCDTIRENTIREIYDINFDIKGDLIRISFSGNGFLHNMIRIMTGTLVFLGLEKINVGDIEKIIDSKDRKSAKKTAPACGLYLKDVIYE